MKVYIILFLLGTLLASGYMPIWWNNPHGYFFKVNQAKLFQSESKVKPDLSKIKEKLYLPIEATLQGVSYRGLITVKPESSKGVSIGGAVYRQTNTAELSLLDGEILEKENHYQIILKPKNAAKIFGSKKHYKSHTEFPISLEIRSKGENNTPYLISPLHGAESQFFRTLPLHLDIEKPYVGKWKVYTAHGDWKYEFSPLPGGQISGVGVFESSAFNCNYPIWGFPVGYQEMVFLTGDSSINTDRCEALSWISKSEEGSVVELVPYNHDGYGMVLIRQ